MTEVQFSSELFMAPEMMYCSLELPSMIEECTKELPDPILKECFSNILLTGMLHVYYAFLETNFNISRIFLGLGAFN